MKRVGKEVTTADYRDSLSAPDTDYMFCLAYQWRDKPHRHVWDLCDEIDRLNTEIAAAMRVLDPSMPSSGIEDAARQVKQCAITWEENFRTIEERHDKLVVDNFALRCELEKLRHHGS